jgi:hypothetical protein
MKELRMMAFDNCQAAQREKKSSTESRKCARPVRLGYGLLITEYQVDPASLLVGK